MNYPNLLVSWFVFGVAASGEYLYGDLLLLWFVASREEELRKDALLFYLKRHRTSPSK
jgi:hypothetical protein